MREETASNLEDSEDNQIVTCVKTVTMTHIKLAIKSVSLSALAAIDTIARQMKFGLKKLQALNLM
jgi:hypothetical protein